MKQIYSDEVLKYIDELSTKYSIAGVAGYISDLKNLRVLMIGETIVDEYIYCEALGKAGKETMLAMKYLSKSRYAGGVLAIANHLAEFCKNVTLVSFLGAEDPEEEFVRGHLNSNVCPHFIYKSDSPTITKRRFLDKYSMTKLLGVYKINDELLNGEEESETCDILSRILPNVDLVIVADYDHGLFTPKVVRFLTENSKYLAVNTQVNAANIGFHAISKYNRADYVCIHEGEVRMDCRNRKGDLKELVLNLVKRIDCKKMLITRGSNGSLFHCAESGFSSSPALAVKVVDRIGAGDAVLAITSLMASANIPPDVIAFIGNIVGAEAVAIVGNERAVSRERLMESVKNFFGG